MGVSRSITGEGTLRLRDLIGGREHGSPFSANNSWGPRVPLSLHGVNGIHSAGGISIGSKCLEIDGLRDAGRVAGSMISTYGSSDQGGHFLFL